MKKMILMCAILSFGTATTVAADPIELSDEAKRNSVIWGSIATGAAAGGPLGAMAGVIAGVWLGEKVEEAGRVDAVKEQLADANNHATKLSQQLAQAEIPVQPYEQVALERLYLELLFKTGDSQLTASGQERIANLASLLLKHPEVHIRLDGHTDPRGNADYNQTLSENRVQTIVELLVANGIANDRIVTNSHGADQSSAVTGDYDGYALERVVKIQLSKGGVQDSYAQVESSQ